MSSEFRESKSEFEQTFTDELLNQLRRCLKERYDERLRDAGGDEGKVWSMAIMGDVSVLPNPLEQKAARIFQELEKRIVALERAGDAEAKAELEATIAALYRM